MVGPRLQGRSLQDHVGGDARLVLAHVREQHPPVHVADGVEPSAGHVLGAELVVDLDRLAGLEPHGVDAEIVGVRATADGDEQLVAGDGAAVVERERDGRTCRRPAVRRAPPSRR